MFDTITTERESLTNLLLIYRIQTEGLGGLRHNTIILNWPEKWNKDYFSNKNRSFDIDEDDNTLSLGAFVRKYFFFLSF